MVEVLHKSSADRSVPEIKIAGLVPITTCSGKVDGEPRRRDPALEIVRVDAHRSEAALDEEPKPGTILTERPRMRLCPSGYAAGGLVISWASARTRKARRESVPFAPHGR